MEFWFSELHTGNVKLSIKIEKQLFSGESEYQRIDVFDSEEFGKFISLDVPKESAFGFMYLLAKEAGTFDHPSLNGVMPELPYPLELCCAGVWHSTEEKIDVLKALGFHDFDFYQTLLKNPMYTNESVEDVVPGYQSGGYVAIIAHK